MRNVTSEVSLAFIALALIAALVTLSLAGKTVPSELSNGLLIVIGAFAGVSIPNRVPVSFTPHESRSDVQQ